MKEKGTAFVKAIPPTTSKIVRSVERSLNLLLERISSRTDPSEKQKPQRVSRTLLFLVLGVLCVVVLAALILVIALGARFFSCVCHPSNRGTEPVVLTETAEPTETPIPTPAPTINPDDTYLGGMTYQKGDTDETIAVVQQRLMDLGYMDPDEPTEHFGSVTLDAIKRFQKRNQLEETGIIDETTYALLFSDKALELWNLCDAFFDHAKPVFVNKNKKEFLLAKDFYRVFETIIDDLVGDNPLPDGMDKKQDDGKIIDHLYTEQSLIENGNVNDQTYYIGDSKYYKIDHEITNESISKQFTYARNIIQWCFNVFGPDSTTPSGVKLRDNITEGYNILPNFFISAKMDEDFRYDRDGIDRTSRVKQRHPSSHFENRIFDRDTLFIYHYDVNFLFVLSLYGRDNEAEKDDWKKKIRDIFKTHIQQWLQEDYDFYAMKSNGNALDGEQVINENFKLLLGKLFRPYEDSEIYSLSLKREKGKDTRDSDEYHLLEEHFVIVPVRKLGDDPQEEINEALAKYRNDHPYVPIPKSMLPLYPLERYENENFVIGLYHNQAHWDWITGANDKGTMIYNIRIDHRRDGSLKKTTIRNLRVKFAFLYEDGKEKSNVYHVFRVHDYAVMSEERMRKAEYPSEPKGDYFIFRFDEEITFGNIDIASLIEDKKRLDAGYKHGTPIFMTGKELILYRK